MNMQKQGYMQLVYYALFNGFVGVLVKEVHGLSPLTLVGAALIIVGAYRVTKGRTTTPAPQEKQQPARLAMATS